MSDATRKFASVPAKEVREALRAKREIALLDVREEQPHATGHPLFAANLPLSRIEMEAYARIPRRTAPIVVLDNGEGYAVLAASALSKMGYTNISLLEDGLQGWRDAGYEVFEDVNAPSKAFGELVETKRHTPSLSAQEVRAMITAKADYVIVDVRRYDEFQTMSIPTAVSVPGAELVLRIRELAPRQETQVIVNCAGRTRSIIGTQSLINAGIPNRIAALRNGTIGWTLAQQELAHGAKEHFPEVDAATKTLAAERARAVADKAGVSRITLDELRRRFPSDDETVYLFDVRTPEEFLESHLPDFRNAPGGQLVQETEMFAPVHGARIVLADNDGSRANMTGSWLAQMGWEVAVLDGLFKEDFTEAGPSAPKVVPPLVSKEYLLTPAELAQKNFALAEDAVILDFASSLQYRCEHIAGARYALRSQLQQALERTEEASCYVVTSPDGVAARFAWADLRALTMKPVYLLGGGTTAWTLAGQPLTSEAPRYASDPIDRYRRPYEGTDAPASAMQAYLDWEYGLVAQLERDGTHGFFVIE
ncbi:MAG: rhodanese-like domain-containing protein [Acidobacteriaceae bacterium]|nr:rhodanese-like domain-containing protein [Acidobacteriaceae bacterium]